MFRGQAIGLTLAAAVLFILPANAKNVRDFESMPQVEQADYIADFVHKMIADVGRQNPALADRIKAFFFRDQPGKSFSKGLEKIEIELAALDIKANRGEVDLSKIQIEGIIVYVTKQEFPPPAKS